MRSFTTTGPIIPDIHHVSLLVRFDLAKFMMLINGRKHFALHAPRQNSKTTSLFELQEKLNSEGRYHCCYINVEVGQASQEDVGGIKQAFLSHLTDNTNSVLNDSFTRRNTGQETSEQSGPFDALTTSLTKWALVNSKPLVLLIAETWLTQGRPWLVSAFAARACKQVNDHPESSIVLDTVKHRHGQLFPPFAIKRSDANFALVSKHCYQR